MRAPALLAALAVALLTSPVLAPVAANAAAAQVGSRVALTPAQDPERACLQSTQLSAAAQADLLDISLLNVGLLGLELPAVAAARIGLAEASIDPSRPQPSSASARYADANLLGLDLPRLGPAEVTQEAPPAAQEPERLHAVSLDLGLARAGVGELAAQAGWDDQLGCAGTASQSGEVTSAATSALADVEVLPGSPGGTGSPLLAVSHQLTSRAATGLRADATGRNAAAYAEIGLAELTLLGGIRVAVISPPRLEVLATGRPGTTVARYNAPVLEISGDGIPAQRLSSAGESIELQLPLLQQVLGQGSLLRLTLGELEREIGAQTVTAAATSLHVQLLSLTERSPLLELGIGRLHASASAPIQVATGQGGGCGDDCDQLPVTGPVVGLVAGTGALILIAGRFLLVASRRRFS